MKREQLEQIVALKGQGGHARTSQDQNSPMTYQLPSRRDIRSDVYSLVVQVSGQWVTRSWIATQLGLKKTPWLTATIEKLVDEGYLVKHIQERGRQLPVCWYAAV